MAITFGGINTGLPANIVDQLIDAERVPVKSATAKKAKTESKLKLVQELEGKMRGIVTNLGEMAGTRGFSDIKLNSGDPNIVNGTVDPESHAKGSWGLEVEKLASKSGALSNGFPDKDKTQIGTGYFKFQTPDGEKEVYLNSKNNTLEGAAAAINNAGVGMFATAVNDRKDTENPWRLLVSGEGHGDDHVIEFPTLYFLDGDQDFFFDDKRPAQNGKVKLDGFEFDINDNVIKDLIPGVTLELKQASPGHTVNVQIKEDQTVIVGKIKKFVDSLNDVLKFIQGQMAVSDKTDTSSTLGGDGTLRQIESDLRRLIQDPQYGMKGGVQRISELGVVFNRNGTLDYDEAKFNSALAKNVTGVQSFLVGDGLNTGFISAVKRTVSRMVDGTGPLANRRTGLQGMIRQADQRIESMERRLVGREKSLRDQFANLEAKMSQLKAQGADLAALGGSGGGGGMNLGGASTSKE